MKNKRNPLAQFVIGLVAVPFIAGIVWLFLNVNSIGARILTVLGIVIILASIISNIRFVFRATSLYAYLLMLILIFGGAALAGQVLFCRPKDRDDKKKR